MTVNQEDFTELKVQTARIEERVMYMSEKQTEMADDVRQILTRVDTQKDDMDAQKLDLAATKSEYKRDRNWLYGIFFFAFSGLVAWLKYIKV